MLPLISVIIPTFNSAHTLTACLESIARQSFRDFEVVIEDGLSSDATEEIVSRFKATSMNIAFYSEKDGGIYDAMNKAIKRANGDWLFFLGSDDKLYDEKVFEDIAKSIKGNPGSKFIYGDLFTSKGNVQSFRNFNFDQLVIFNIGHQAIFYHASLFENMTYDTQFRLLADWDFNLKIFADRIRPLHLDRIIAYYNLDGASRDWTKTDEYRKHFSDKRILYLRYKGRFAYYTYLYRKVIFTVKKTLKQSLHGGA